MWCGIQSALFLLTVFCRLGASLSPAAFGGVVEHAGAISNTIRQTAAWQRIKLNVDTHGGIKDRFARLFPEKTMNLVSSFVDRFRAPGDDVIVTTTMGSLRGRVMLSKSDPPIPYFSFRGIRYGQSPVGPLRFMAPVPVGPWSGVRDARKEGSVCPHRNLLLETFTGQEDCLFLNVHTPLLPLDEDLAIGVSELLPVMVWLHGGGFNVGSGNSFLYGPDYLLAEDVVVVTLNYRLNALGYLSTQDSTVPGNAGLKDQVLALRWVQDHIERFGGDPRRVTIFGQSAGGAAVHYLMVSPLATGLFHQAIAQSGTALSPWALSTKPRDRAFRLGAALGIHTNRSEELIYHLRQVPFKQLFDASNKTLTAEDGRNNIGIPFVPVVEDFPGAGIHEPVFLPEHPLDLLQKGRFHKVPLMMGYNTHEAMLFIRRYRKNPSILEEIDNDFTRMIPLNLNVTGGRESPDGQIIAQHIRQFYLGGRAVTLAVTEEMIYLFTDTFFTRGIVDSTRIQRSFATAGAPIYLYRFSFDGALGYFKRLLGINRQGVCHGDELGYLFHFGFFNKHLDPASHELLVKRRMVRLWTNFAKYGNPTPAGAADRLLGVNWKPASASIDSLPFLDMGGQLKMGVNLEPARLAFWDDLYEKHNKYKSGKYVHEVDEFQLN